MSAPVYEWAAWGEGFCSWCVISFGVLAAVYVVRVGMGIVKDFTRFANIGRTTHLIVGRMDW